MRECYNHPPELCGMSLTPCSGVRQEDQEEHELEFHFSKSGHHPTHIKCSCGKEFNVAEQ